MSVTSSSPSPSPTPPPASSGSTSQQQHQFSTKPGALVAAIKSILSEQSTRLLLKHNTDLDLLEDLRIYLKNRCALERDYAQSLAKLNQSYAKRSTAFLNFVANEDENSDIKTIYTTWKIYQEETEKHAKNRLQQFEQLATVCETLKTMRAHKIQVAKKCLDNYLKKMHEEVISSVNEIDKTRKLYFEEEHLAKQARDKEEKIKKRKTGIFASFTSLQNKKERTSAHREASDIQSTQARNDYIMALAAGNAHLEHYFQQDLVNLMLTIDDMVLDRCRNYMLNLLSVEKESAQQWWEIIEHSIEMVDKTSADYTNQVFLKDPNSSSLTETLFYEFQPCDNDPIDYISLEHNADIALKNEGQKWFTWFCKECRNLNRLSAQLVKLQAMLSEGHKTVELPGSGQVDIEQRIDEIRQQLRKCEISKLKAKARLQVIKESGAEVEDFIAFEQQVASEIKQSLDVDNLAAASLSRTPSIRSHTELEAKSSLNKNDNESMAGTVPTHQNLRPESSSSIEQLDSPDREMLQMGTSVESTSPGPQAGVYSSQGNQSSSWADPMMSYDPTQAWNSESTMLQDNGTGFVDDQQQQQPIADNSYGANDDQIIQEDIIKPTMAATTTQENFSYDTNAGTEGFGEYDSQQQTESVSPAITTYDGYALIGKQCFALYSYTASNEDELSFMEQDILSVMDACDKDWVQAQDKDGRIGYVPASYLQPMPVESQWNEEGTYAYNTNSNQDIIETTTQESALASSSDQEYNETNKEVAIAPSSMPLPSQPPSEQPIIPPGSEQPKMGKKGEHQTGDIYAHALYDYVATNSEEISFKAGDLIRIIDNSSEDGWWTGANPQGQIGHFPSMLVSGPEEEDDENEDEDEESDEEETDADEENSELALPAPLPPPPPPILEMEPPLPPPPPPIPSVPKVCTESIENRIDPQLPLPPPPPPPPPTSSSNDTSLPSVPPPQPPSFAPPPKPMQLMAPQAVVIIQPTPEIESRPTIGSTSSSNSSSQNNPQQQNCSKTMEKNDDGTKNSQTISQTSPNVTAAAQELSETITQQAMDDFKRELAERRRSSATSTSSAANPSTPTTTAITAVTTNQSQNENSTDLVTTTTTTTATTEALDQNGDINDYDDYEDIK